MDFSPILEGIKAMSPYEVVGAIISALGVWLAVRQKVLTWPVSMVGVALYIFVCYQARLYADMGLQVFYLGTSIFGWYTWLYGGQGNTGLKVTRIRLQEGIFVAFLTILFSVILGFLLQNYTNADVPFADSALTGGSLAAYWLQARKRLENWLLWVLVDALYIGLFWYKELYITAVLYGLFTVMAAQGYFIWRRDLHTKYYA